MVSGRFKNSSLGMLDGQRIVWIAVNIVSHHNVEQYELQNTVSNLPANLPQTGRMNIDKNEFCCPFDIFPQKIKIA